MCNSGFYRIPGSNVCFSLSIFSPPQIFLIVFLESLFFLVFLSFFAAFSSQPIPSFYNGVFGLPEEPLVPLFYPFANRAHLVSIILVSPISIFSYSFLLSALILLKVPIWPSSLGCAEVCPSRHPRLWRFPLFRFLSHLGGILFCHFESRLVSFFLLCFSVLVPRDFFCLCHERSLGSTDVCVLFCFCFLFFLLLSFFF